MEGTLPRHFGALIFSNLLGWAVGQRCRRFPGHGLHIRLDVPAGVIAHTCPPLFRWTVEIQ